MLHLQAIIIPTLQAHVFIATSTVTTATTATTTTAATAVS